MLHARIAARAFNTPLLVEPSKAMAFLAGLGSRILGRPVEIAAASGRADPPALPPVRASFLTGGLLEDWHRHGDAPYPVVDGVAVIEIAGVLIHRGSWIGQSSGQTSYEGVTAQIEAAAHDPSVRGVALEIDSFGGEVAGVFDLADRIRALRRDKPVWAFVAEHAFSAGYALASQATRILLPRTGALGSIGVVVLHADLSRQLDREGVRVTLVHSGSHKVDGNPYEPLPEAVRDDIQREIDGLRFLFAETVAAGRAGRLDQQAALATEAATCRGADAVAAGLADEVSDLARGFAAFRQHVARARRAPLAQTGNPTQPRKEIAMTPESDDDDTAPDSITDTQDPRDGAREVQGDGQRDTGGDTGGDAAPAAPASPTAPAATAPPVAAVAPETSAAPTPAAPTPGNLAEISAQLREAAAEIAEIAAQAGRLGVAIDAARALRDATTPEALRRLVLERASAAADARDIVAAPPSPVLPRTQESPIVAAAKRAASAGVKR